MEFKDVLGFVFQVFGGSALSLGLAWWLGRRLILHILEKERDAQKAALDAELETHKSQLRAASDLALERVRTLDQFARTEHEVMLSRLQDRRAAIIGSLYAKIVEASESTGAYVMNASPNESERSLKLGQIAYDTLEAMRRYFFARKCGCRNIAAQASKNILGNSSDSILGGKCSHRGGVQTIILDRFKRPK